MPLVSYAVNGQVQSVLFEEGADDAVAEFVADLKAQAGVTGITVTSDPEDQV